MSSPFPTDRSNTPGGTHLRPLDKKAKSLMMVETHMEEFERRRWVDAIILNEGKRRAEWEMRNGKLKGNEHDWRAVCTLCSLLLLG